MAEVTIKIDDHHGEVESNSEKIALMESFKKKYQDIDKMFNNRMVLSENNQITFFPDLGHETFSTRDRKEDNLTKGVFKLYSSDVTNQCDFSFGEEPFEEEFYKDLLNLYLKCFDYKEGVNETEEPTVYVEVIGYPGSYECNNLLLTEKGLKWTDILFYEEEDDER